MAMLPLPQCEVLAGPVRDRIFPVEPPVGVDVRVSVGRARMVPHEGRLVKLVLQEYQVLGQRLAAPQPDPRLRDVRVRVERAVLVACHLAAVVVDVQLVGLREDMALHLLDLETSEAGGSVGARDLRQVVGDLCHVGVVGTEQLVGVDRPARLNVGVEQVGRPNAETT
jgi:hypothetical protein